MGRGLSNYNPIYAKGNLTINPAPLTIQVVNDAKLVTSSDSASYGGVIASGFKNGETLVNLGGTLVISRSNASVQSVGSYTGVLNASGYTSSNYAITYVPGNFDILPVETLLVKMGNVSATYGNALTYSPVASYLTANNTLIASSNVSSGLTVTTNGNQVQVSDGVGGQYSFVASPTGGQLSSSGVLNAGSYLLSAGSPVISGSSFTRAFVVGAATILPKALAVGTDFTIAPITKVYDGNTSIASAGSAVIRTAASNIRASDLIQVASSGSYAHKNVGSGLSYAIDINLTGTDAGNYYISGGSSATGSNGVITQLTTPVSWVGPTAGGYWSNPSNWTGGAIPDFANVQSTTIPAGVSVIYDAGLTTPVQTIVSNSGNITFASLPAGAQSIPMNINGSGSVTISDGASIRLAGTSSSYSGNTILGAASRVIAATNNAIGAGNIQSNGGEFGVASSVVLPRIVATGSMTLVSSIDTVGAQSYGNLTLASTANGLNTSGSGTQTIALRTSNANIQLNGSINGLVDKTQSLTIDAGTANVTIGGSTGNQARLEHLSVTGGRINILADILTSNSQTYNGAVYIGDASYIGQTPSVGFLFTTQYRRYFSYSGSGTSSSISHLNNDPIYVRTLVSEDPEITFNGTVNDTVANTHTLLLAAIAPTSSSTWSNASSINFNQGVGNTAPLYSLNAQVIVERSQADSLSAHIGSIQVRDGVETYSDQTYRANVMVARSSNQPGTVTFSVFDPNAAINYLLPVQTASNSSCQGATCGRMNLQNPNHLDALVINGDNNYGGNQNNALGAGYWRAPATENNALGYVAPVVQPTLPPQSTEQRNPPPFHQSMQNLLSNTMNMGIGSAGSVKVSMISSSTQSTGDSSKLGPDSLRTYGNLNDIPAPIAKTLNVIIQTRVNGELLNFATSAPTDGFVFAMPEVLTPRYTFVSQQLAADGLPNTLQLAAVRPDGKPLPSWLKFNPETKTFTADRVPEGTPDMQLKIQTVQDGRVIEEIIVTIDLPN
jgi:hypothetical protein